MTVCIRRIRTGEGELFRQLRLRSLRDAPYAFSSRYERALERSETSWAEQADSTAEGSDRATFVAWLEDEPVGIAALYRDPVRGDTGQVLQVWVTPEERGTRLARELLRALLQWAGETGFRTVKATVRKGNARAARFYQRLGFSLAHGDSLDGADEAVFVRELAVEVG